MKNLIVILLLLLLCSFCISCASSSDIYWRTQSKSGIEKYTRYKPGWGYYENCKTYSNNLPTKKSKYYMMLKRYDKR